MRPLHFILASLRHYRRIHVAVGLGVAVATAVLTGALLVGDSVRGSLRDLTLERLGRIDEVLLVGPMFRAQLADELAAEPRFKEHYANAEPAIFMPGTLQAGGGRNLKRATQISVYGCRPEFWSLGQGGPSGSLMDGDVAITETIARELGVNVGDSVLLRVPAVGAIPADSALGKKGVDKTTKARQFKLAAVLPGEGLARFGLQPSQHSPRNVFLPLESLQKLLEQPGRANLLLIAGRDTSSPPAEAASQALQAALRPRLADYGLKLELVESPTPYLRLSSDQLVLRDEFVAAAERAFENERHQPVVTYLANSIVAGDGNAQRKIPYSTISGVDSVAGIGPVLDADGQPIAIGDDEIVLNRWAADNLSAKPGDRVRITFYEPESRHGELIEHEPLSFALKAVAELKSADGQHTTAADSRLTPELPGVTDQSSIRDWDMPFELVETIRNEDEDYWDAYRTTPKAFVSLATAQRLWSSRWGAISMIRLPAGESASAIDQWSERLERAIDPASVGLTFQPVKRLGLAAASGTTPFDGLFLGFSFFLIAAAVMLIALLFQLGVTGRATELGVMSSVGIDENRMARMLVREGLIVAAIGAAVGAAGGVVYAWLMIMGLRTWWVAAIATPFLELHATPKSLAIGWVAGVLVTWLTIRWSIRGMVRLPVGRLLAGQVEIGIRGRGSGDTEGATGRERRSRLAIFQSLSWPMMRLALLAMTVPLSIGGFWLRDEGKVGAFFASGALVLALLLGEIRHRLRSARQAADGRGSLSLAALARLNTSRHPGRSTLTIGLVAAASFIIIAMSAFRLESSDAGTGGFDLIATSDQPINYDLNTPEGRLELSLSDRESDALAKWRVFSWRVNSGEDASCRNLYKPSQPTVLGVPNAMIERGGFAWAATKNDASPLQNESSPNPWQLLNTDLGNDSQVQRVIPVVIDANTATYSLQIGGIGERITISDEADRPMTLEVVGLLKNSMLQGKLLVSEANFQHLYPSTSGYRFFLLDRPNEAGGDLLDAAAVTRLLESRLADEGFHATPADDQLAEFLAVQNTYLSTFQSLGALGLLLGTIGLAVVQLRSVLERRGELALMRASGFRRRRLVGMVTWENVMLLFGGLAVGCVAAAVALLPQWGPQAASVPWRTLAALLSSVAIVGLAAGWLATRSALRAPIVPALRGD
jgi:ABC-type antimicrobial peptide transport system permease subunit